MYRSDIYLSSEMGSLRPTSPNISLGVENGMSVEMGTHSVTPSAGVRVVRQLLAVYATLLKSSGLDGLELWNGSCQLVQTQTASEQIH